MVQLEQNAAATRGRGPGQDRGRGRSLGPGSIYGAWRKRWRELDERLGALRQSNADGFSNLMMRQKVVIEDATPAQRTEVARVLGEVIEQFKSAIKENESDEARVTDLRFERKELEALRARLRRRRR